MQAIEPPIPLKQPVKKSRSATRRKSRQQSFPHQAIALETTAKLVANLVLSAAAVCALIQLLPYRRAVQEKLQEIQAEVTVTQGRVAQAKADLGRYFDPTLAKSIMQEYTNRVDPQQRQIIWVEPGAPEPEAPAPQP